MFNSEKAIHDLAKKRKITFDQARWTLHQINYRFVFFHQIILIGCILGSIVQTLLTGTFWIGWAGIFGSLLPVLLFHAKRVYECEFQTSISWKQLILEIKKEIVRKA